MPTIKSVDREEILEVVVNPNHVLKLTDNWLDANYFTEDSADEKIVRPGLVVAQESTSKKYVPYNSSALYGAGSDTPVGVIGRPVFLTHDDAAVAPIFHGKLIEDHCYVWGGTLGDISNDIKTALQMIEWV